MFTRKHDRGDEPALKVVPKPVQRTLAQALAFEPAPEGKSDPMPGSAGNSLAVAAEPFKAQAVPPLSDSHRAANRVPACDGIVIIGKGTRIVGEISDCILIEIQGVLEGKVVAESVVVREGGGFQGSLSAQTAEISGVVEGTIAVTGVLNVHATGEITAETTYGQLAIEHGGTIHGNFKASSKVPATASESRYEPAINGANGAAQYAAAPQRVDIRSSVGNGTTWPGNLNS